MGEKRTLHSRIVDGHRSHHGLKTRATDVIQCEKSQLQKFKKDIQILVRPSSASTG